MLSACNLFSQLVPTVPVIPTLPEIMIETISIDDQYVLPTLPELALPTTDAESLSKTLVGDLEEMVEAETKGAAVAAAVQVLVDLKEASADQITVESAEAQAWSDTCFDVPREDTDCQPFIVPGFRVILAFEGNRYEVRTNLDGSDLVLVP
jgi:hypothetical protein